MKYSCTIEFSKKGKKEKRKIHYLPEIGLIVGLDPDNLAFNSSFPVEQLPQLPNFLPSHM